LINYLDHALLLNSSYQHWTGKPLDDEVERGDDPEAMLALLNQADYALISHGTEADPVFNYGNLVALKLFETSFEALIQMPSRASAEPDHRPGREVLFDRVRDAGFIDDYRGMRISVKGQKFHINKAVVWQLIDPLGRVHGHAAKLIDWHLVDD